MELVLIVIIIVIIIFFVIIWNVNANWFHFQKIFKLNNFFLKISDCNFYYISASFLYLFLQGKNAISY